MAILEQPFYHQTIKLYTSVFGTLFNDMSIVRKDGKTIKVPLYYAEKQPANVRMDQNEDPNAARYKRRVPRLAYKLTDWRKDSTRQKNKMHQLTNQHALAGTDTTTKTQYNRVPYTFDFELVAVTKYIDDLLQIVEQIAVYFNPSIQVVVNDNPDLSDESAITITMTDSTKMQPFEGSFEDEREIEATFNFTLDGYLYMPTSDSSIIKTIYLNYYDLDDPDTMIDQTILTESDAP